MYGIDDALLDNAEREQIYVLLKKHYPDAYYTEGKWVSPSLKVDDCDTLLMESDAGKDPFLTLCRTLYDDEVRVKVHPPVFDRAKVLHFQVDEFFLKNPDLHASILNHIKSPSNGRP